MKNFWQTCSTVVAIAALSFFLLYQLVMLALAPVNWRAARAAPIAPWSVPQMIIYGGNGRCGEVSCKRETVFLTMLSPQAIQAFYRESLSEHGWHHRCTAGPGLPTCTFPYQTSSMLVGDVFDRSGTWDPLVVRIEPSSEGVLHTVRIIEPAPVQLRQTRTGADSEHPLVGGWQGTDAEGRLFLLRFFGDRTAWIERGASEASQSHIGGRYTWEINAEGRLTLRNFWDSHSFDLNCADLPAFLQPDCDRRRANDDQNRVSLIQLDLDIGDGSLTFPGNGAPAQTVLRIND